MKVQETALPGVLVIEPLVHADERGYFFEAWQAARYDDVGVPGSVQTNISHSGRGVLRGLHFQHPIPQAKLVTVLQGTVFDVVVDVRANSPTLGKWLGIELSARNRLQLYVPEGFAHGFVVTDDDALMLYQCSASYTPGAEHSLRWCDPELDIRWPLETPILSAKDHQAPLLRDLTAEGSLPPYSR